jgi:signal transduction histidine kinase/CheY-like chemotaxis protein
MYYGLRMSPEANPDLISSVTELLQSTWRSLILVTGGVYLAWFFLGTWNLERLALNLLPVTGIVFFTSAFSLWLLSKRLVAAQVVWQLGIAAAITLTAHVSRQPEVAFCYILLPLMAAVTVNWTAGFLTEGLVIALVWWLSHTPVVLDLPGGYGLAIAVGGALTGMVGWAVTHALLTVTQWSLFSFEQVRQKIEELRDQRMELKQVQEDLTQSNRELARLSDRLKAMYQVAEEARRAKEELVANVSHELRTPLNMIIGFSEMITQSPQIYGVRLPSALLADITAIQRNSQHLAKLVDDVLDLSQVEAGRMALSKEWVSLQGIVDEATTAVRALYESKGLYLQTGVSPDLPPIFCDSTRIRQVILNLLSNAGRFTERGGVRLNAWREKNDVVVSVSDTGPGIALEDQEKIFEPFQQLDGSIRRRHGGSGLGLNISKRFVEMHGGKMWLESEVGVGTTFYFNLPLETSLPAALASGDDARRWFSLYHEYGFRVRTRRSKAPAPVVVPRYVLVEEGETLQQLLSRYADNIEIASFQDVDEAIRELSRSPAQALVVNTSPFEEMPAPVDQLTNLPYGTPAMTCWVPGEDEAARQLGVVRYLVKPVTREMLLSTLEHLGEGMKSVLLVDDQPEVLQFFARILSSAEHSYDILLAKNGRRALSLLRERRPDVMLLDLIMPGMSGFQVLQEKDRDPLIRYIPVVVISARDPSGEPVASDTLTVTRGGGLSVRDLLACIQAVSEILSPSIQPDGLGRPEKPAV